MYNLTHQRRKVFDAIAAFIAQHNGVSPTVREILVMTGIKDTVAVQDHLDNLEQRGWIKRLPVAKRSITIIHPAGAEKERERVNQS